MSVLLTIGTAAAAGWVIDRLAFNGDFSAVIRDEIARLRRPTKTSRRPRRTAAKR
jgi:hypothetical protein